MATGRQTVKWHLYTPDAGSQMLAAKRPTLQGASTPPDDTFSRHFEAGRQH